MQMDNPRRHFYNKMCRFGNRIDLLITIAEQIPCQKSANGSTDTTPMPIEMRGITFHQRLAIKVSMEDRSRRVEEGWISTKDHKKTLLTPDTLTLYNLSQYIINLYT